MNKNIKYIGEGNIFYLLPHTKGVLDVRERRCKVCGRFINIQKLLLCSECRKNAESGHY